MTWNCGATDSEGKASEHSFPLHKMWNSIGKNFLDELDSAPALLDLARLELDASSTLELDFSMLLLDFAELELDFAELLLDCDELLNMPSLKYATTDSVSETT